ncbi:LacI family transcriptional regulator [Xylanibacillus composti]|nr:LacI family DNA-binding transcriptional regulator [Xylanibacillus composti]MDT9726231.1 LacI family transcriptional regulator [Xylanibacillus composti]
MTKKITMQQIADHLGVSKFVVSKALSGKGGVSESTKERVIQAASQLGYFAQKNAYMKNVRRDVPTAGAGGNKQSVLVLMPNIRFQTRDSLYWGKILDGISARLEEIGLGMVIISEQSIDHFLHILNPNGILGLIGVGEISTSLLLEVHRIGLPMVLVDHEDPLIPSDTIFVNNYDCMSRLTKHLIGIGHKRMNFIGNARYSRSFHDRWIAFRSVLEENQLQTDMKEEWLFQLEGIQDFQEQIKLWAIRKQRAGQLPTAVLCANDMIAIDAVNAFNELGLAVPHDISVTGFDNIEDAYRTKPALTTVNVPKEAMGKKAVEQLLLRIDKKQEPLEKILILGEVIYRESITRLVQKQHS